MKTTRLALTIIALMALSQVAMAQSAGTITLNGTVPVGFSFTNTSNGSIGTVTVNLASLAVPLSPAMVTDTSTTLRLRSNKAYKVMASASAPNAPTGTPAGGDTMLLKDIGFGITAIVGTAGVGNLATGRTDTIAPYQDYTTGGNLTAVPADGLTPFGPSANKGSLEEIATSIEILHGDRISKRGNVVTTDNFIAVTLGFAVLPQYFTPDTGFTTSILLTMSTP